MILHKRAVCASNLLPYAQSALAIGYRMRSVRYQFATVCAVYANKADHMLILAIYLNQVLTNENSEKSEKASLTPSNGPQRNPKHLSFGANSKSKIVASVW